MKDLQIIVVTRTMAEGVQAFAVQALGMLTPPPMKAGILRSRLAADALLDGIMRGIDEIAARLEEGDSVTLRLAGSAAGADPVLTAQMRTVVTGLRRRGIDILLEEVVEGALPQDLLRRMTSQIEMSAALRM